MKDLQLYKLLTKERVNEAFQKTCEEVKPSEGKFVLVTEEYQKAVEKAGNEAFDQEVLGMASGAKWVGCFADQFWADTFKHVMSVALVNDDNEILAIRLVRIQNVEAEFTDLSKVEDKAFRTMFGFIAYCDEKANFAKHFEAKEMFHHMGLAVPEKYRHRGFGTKIMEFSLKFIQNLKLEDKFAIKGEATSIYSQRIYEKLGYKCIFEIKYKDYKEDGKAVLKDTGEHETLKMYGMLIG